MSVAKNKIQPPQWAAVLSFERKTELKKGRKLANDFNSFLNRQSL